MIQQDNIKDFATAAFRHYAHTKHSKALDVDDITIIIAISSTIHHLECEHDTIALAGIRQVYFKLPKGNLKRGEMSSYVRRTALDIHVSESLLWNKLRRARQTFNYYYKQFTYKYQE